MSLKSGILPPKAVELATMSFIQPGTTTAACPER